MELVGTVFFITNRLPYHFLVDGTILVSEGKITKNLFTSTILLLPFPVVVYFMLMMLIINRRNTSGANWYCILNHTYITVSFLGWMVRFWFLNEKIQKPLYIYCSTTFIPSSGLFYIDDASN